MTTLADPILSGAGNCPPMLEKDMYDSWKRRIELYMMNRQHGRMILESIENGPLFWPTFKENRVTRPKKYSELFATEAIQADCDVKATNIILQRLPPESYVPVDSNSFVSADILPPWKQAKKIYLLGSKKWYQSLLGALTKEEFFSPFNLTSLITMSDTDSLVNSVHEGDAPEQKVTPPPQITTVTSLSAKFPYLKKGEYDIWAMKLKNYISSADLQCWNIVQKGNSQKNITLDTEGNIIIAPPVTAEEHMQVQR
nr:ribonuclease H-like domain-containing protein [Tanacetum cinerariifolium]